MLTVRQPWAWAIVHAGKDVENRSRSLGPYRGPVAIHAGLRYDYLAASLPLSRAMVAAGGASSGRPWMENLGAIIGVVDLVDAHHESASARDCCSDWADNGAWHLRLENPRALEEPLAWSGGLGLRKAPLLEVAGDWLCQVVEGCTCHGPVSGPHEPGCGLEPLSRLVGVSS